MKTPVRPELPTAALRSSHATHAAVDNSAPSAIRPESTYKSGKVVQTNGATSGKEVIVPALRAIDPRKAVVGISAFHEPLDGALFEQPRSSRAVSATRPRAPPLMSPPPPAAAPPPGPHL